MDLPPGVGEYVVLPELVHLFIPNHRLVLKLYLDGYVPDWRERGGGSRNLKCARPETASLIGS